MGSLSQFRGAGSKPGVGDGSRSRQTARGFDAGGYRPAGYNRELYTELGGDRDTWVTELQKPVITR